MELSSPGPTAHSRSSINDSWGGMGVGRASRGGDICILTVDSRWCMVWDRGFVYIFKQFSLPSLPFIKHPPLPLISETTRTTYPRPPSTCTLCVQRRSVLFHWSAYSCADIQHGNYVRHKLLWLLVLSFSFPELDLDCHCCSSFIWI